METWIDIQEYDGLYQVSDKGNVKRIGGTITDKSGRVKYIPERILQPIENDGYLYVCLCRDGKAKRFAVHRLVATAFIQNTENKPAIDHINGKKSDNRVENIRWSTSKENNNNPVTRNKYLQNHCRQIERIDINGKIKTYNSITEAIAEGFDRTNINRCCNGKCPLYKNFVWRYKGSHNKDGVTVNDELAKRKVSKRRKDSHYVERRKDGEIKIYEKPRDVEADGFSYINVVSCCLCLQGRKSHKGYEWRYLDKLPEGYKLDKTE